jgi:hypothetical protein
VLLREDTPKYRNTPKSTASGMYTRIGAINTEHPIRKLTEKQVTLCSDEKLNTIFDVAQSFQSVSNIAAFNRKC